MVKSFQQFSLKKHFLTNMITLTSRKIIKRFDKITKLFNHSVILMRV